MSNFKKPFKNQGGFTLIEVLIAIFVLGAMSLSWVKLNSIAFKVVQNNQATQMATQIVGEYFETLKRNKVRLRSGCNPLKEDWWKKQGRAIFMVNSILVDRTLMKEGLDRHLDHWQGCAVGGVEADSSLVKSSRVSPLLADFVPFFEMQDLRNFKILLVKVTYKDYSTGKQGELKRIASFYD